MKEEVKPLAIYTTSEVAKLFGLTQQTVQKYIREGKIKAKHIGNKWYRFSGQAILDFMKINDSE
jgi:excisionase family DNA binding protein